MNSSTPPLAVRWLPTCLLFCLLACLSATLAQDGPDLLETETLGGLKIGLPEKKLVALIGQPKSKSTLVLEAATGEYFQNWNYPDKGLEIRMCAGESKKGAKQVAGFTASAGCTFATTKGVKIGSTEAETRKAYGALEDKEYREPGSLVAGSIYGGIIFNFERGKVVRIFFGAAAE